MLTDSRRGCRASVRALLPAVVMCLGPPCVELAMEFVFVLKTVPVLVERVWFNILGELAKKGPGVEGEMPTAWASPRTRDMVWRFCHSTGMVSLVSPGVGAVCMTLAPSSEGT